MTLLVLKWFQFDLNYGRKLDKIIYAVHLQLFCDLFLHCTQLRRQLLSNVGMFLWSYMNLALIYIANYGTPWEQSE